MRTTVNLDADVYRAAASLAAAKKSTLGKVLSDLARRGLAPAVVVRSRDGFPVFDVPTGAPPITSEMVREAEEDV
ncbi:MAG: antitoxin [Holophagales bacterium]|nr:antitoxin [Holophagales bacterium]